MRCGAAAKAIKDATGVAGYGQMAMDNTGGWQITAATYSRGGRIQVANDDGTYTATLDNPGTTAALEFLQALRWEDDSLLPDATINWVTANETFAAGQVGMYTSGSDVYTALAESFGVAEDSSGLRIADYGLTAIPNEGSDSGVLVGGTLAAVNVRADDAVKGRRRSSGSTSFTCGRSSRKVLLSPTPNSVSTTASQSARLCCRSSAVSSTRPRWAGSPTSSMFHWRT